MNESWKIKKLSHTISNQKINDIYDLAIKNGAHWSN